ncbi:hypothetical protein C8R46DRAFT_1305417 [Mycena filopes]|nr:hypothetical protein C8R46DRAFT_1305417 [Mycena filopes]
MSLRWDSSSRIAPAFPRAFSFVQAHPHLRNNIRDLKFDIPSSHKDQAVLEAVLRMLGNLERLAINGYGREWDKLLQSLASAILTAISLPSLERFHLRRLTGVPPSVILHAASSTRVLSLTGIVPQRHGSVPAVLAPTTQLEYLILPWSLTTQTLLDVCAFLLTAQNLRRLIVNARHQLPLTTASAAHLRYLTITFGVTSDPLELPLLPVLEQLTLVITEILSLDSALSIVPPALNLSLNILPTATPHLAILGLTVRMRSMRPTHRWEPHTPLPIFAARSYRTHLPQLCEIHCSLGYLDPFFACEGRVFEEAYGYFVALMQEELLPVPHAEGMLTFGRERHQTRMNYMDDLP